VCFLLVVQGVFGERGFTDSVGLITDWEFLGVWSGYKHTMTTVAFDDESGDQVLSLIFNDLGLLDVARSR
jgi:hypothetical protein